MGDPKERSSRQDPASGHTLWAYPLGIPSVYDRVCQQALVNRLEPIFEKVFDPSSLGYRKGRKPADALGKIWREMGAGSEWIVDADLKDYFGSVDHEKLMTLVGKQVADGRVLKLIQQMLKAGYEEKGQRYETPRGTPQGGVVSPLLSNILLTPFDKEMRQKGYRLTRWADDWVVTCRTRAEAENALAQATKILDKLGVTLNREKAVLVLDRDGVVVEADDPGVGESDPEDVAGEVVQHGLSSTACSPLPQAVTLRTQGWCRTSSGMTRSGHFRFSSARNLPRTNLARALTGTMKFRRAGCQVPASSESPPPLTRQWTCGWKASCCVQVCSTASTATVPPT
jgi:Reverse transcriptase (RNA-dependent DNA polymerase)